jgi:hypothetical protein
VRYAQEIGKWGLVHQRYVGLASVGPYGRRHGNLFGLGGAISRSVIFPKTPRWQDCRIIPVKKGHESGHA